ncbi:unnamed protein product [Timema podura]|uniref:Uncharacterized protein n=1 Tax=Timema podura TaxID=61482 RepID=A0ABN7P513_TIMPD|nr:unnamed protein product [Timema podura]
MRKAFEKENYNKDPDNPELVLEMRRRKKIREDFSALFYDDVQQKRDTTAMINKQQVFAEINGLEVIYYVFIWKTEQGLNEEGLILEVIYLHLLGRRVGNYLDKTTLSRADWDSNFNCPHEAELTPFQTNCSTENLGATRIKPLTSGSVARKSDHWTTARWSFIIHAVKLTD